MSSVAQPGAEAPPILSELRDGVLVVTLNRPERLNASTPELLRLYTETLLAAADDGRVRVIVVTGAGRGFCAGADTGVLGKLADGAPRPAKLRRHWFVTEIPKPVIAAINGPCVGVGFVMAMMCDMRFAADTATAGPVFAKLGLPAENGLAWILPRVVGYARAFEVLNSGKLYAGEDLLRLGLVNEVVPAQDLMRHTMEIATAMARNCSPRSFATIKAQLHQGFDTSLREADRLSEQVVQKCLAADDFKEAMRSRKEKRPPEFAPLLADRTDWWPAGEKMPTAS